MYVGDILRTNRAHVVTIGSNETVSIAAGLMHASNVGALAVRHLSRSKDAAVVGMFSERDVVTVIAERGTGRSRDQACRTHDGQDDLRNTQSPAPHRSIARSYPCHPAEI